MDDPADPQGSSFPVVTARPIVAASDGSRARRFDLHRVSTAGAVLDLALALVAVVGAPLAMQTALLLLLGGDALAAPPSLHLITILKWFEAAVVVALAGFFVHRHRLRPEAFGLQTARLGRQVAWAGPVFVGMYVVLVGTGMLLVLWVAAFPEWLPDIRRRTEFLETMPLDNTAAAVLLLIPVAIHEELLFRGLLIPYLRRIGLGWVGAVTLSTCLFALLHYQQGWLGIVQIFPVGLLLAVAFVLTRSLTAVMLAHFCFDLLQFHVARFLLPWAQEAFDQLDPTALIG